MVDYYIPRAAVFTRQGQMKYNLTIHGARALWGAARQGQVLLITDRINGLMHVVQESGKYIKHINTSLTELRGIAADNNIIWLTTWDQGLHKMTLDADFNIVNLQLFTSNSPSFNAPWDITIHGSQIIVVCGNSHNLHIFYPNGTHVVPYVNKWRSGLKDDQLSGPLGVVTDSNGYIYVVDSHNYRIVLFSPTGQFIHYILTQGDGMVERPNTVYLHDRVLFATAGYTLYAVPLT